MSDSCSTKEALLATMIELIWENSYSGISVEDICQRAGVKKGSFYHFFPSKADLAVHAMEHHWLQREPHMDQIFSAQHAPWIRFERLVRDIVESQTAKQKECGKVLGCPFFTVVAEMSTQDEQLRQQAEIMNDRYLRYYESTIRDGIACGVMAPGNPAEKARQAFAFVMGILLQAKVRNDVAPLKLLASGLRDLLGVHTLTARAA